MDEWVSEDLCKLRDSTPVGPEIGSRKRKRGRWPGPSSSSNREASSSMNGFSWQNSLASTSAVDGERRENGSERLLQGSLTEEELDASQHKQLTAQRNFDTVIFDEWKIRPWCVKFLLPLRVDGIYCFIGTILLIRSRKAKRSSQPRHQSTNLSKRFLVYRE